jgi:hypothetical protein
MGLDTKIYCLTDRKSQCEFDFGVENQKERNSDWNPVTPIHYSVIRSSEGAGSWLDLVILKRAVFADVTLRWTCLYTKKADVPVPGFRKYLTQTLASLNSQCHAITHKFSEAGTVAQVHKVLSDIEILAGCTLPEAGESSEWTSIV